MAPRPEAGSGIAVEPAPRAILTFSGAEGTRHAR